MKKRRFRAQVSAIIAAIERVFIMTRGRSLLYFIVIRVKVEIRSVSVLLYMRFW